MSKRFIQFLSVFIGLTIVLGIQKLKAQNQVYVQSIVYVSSSFGGFPNILNQDHYGSGVTNMGDLNGDGVPDLAVGAYTDKSVSGAGAGVFYILFMNANGTVKSYVKNAAPKTAVNFGISVANIGDIDGDGVPDLAVGSSGDPSSSSGLVNSGCVYICLMKANGTVKSTTQIAGTSMSNWSSTQTVSGPQFGYSVAGTGDINQDGVNDIIVGAIGDKDGTSGAIGSAYIVFLTNTGGLNGSQKITSGVGNFPTGILGTTDEFGSAVAGIGDFNKDGYLDVAVGAINTSDKTASSGAFYILNLDNTGKVITSGVSKISNSSTGMNNILPKNENFGCGLTYLPDFGYKKLNVMAVGAGGLGTATASCTGDNDYRTGAGAVWLIFLDSANNVLYNQKISGINPAISSSNNHLLALDHFGLSVTDYGTASSNTVQKLVIGAPYDSGYYLYGTGQGSFYEINFAKPEVKVDTILYPAETLCSNSVAKLAVVFQNLSTGPISKIPFQANITGATSITLQDTFYGTVAQNAIDTMYFKISIPTNKSGTDTIVAFHLYPGDFDPYDDTVKRTTYILPLFTPPNFGPDTSYICSYSKLTLDMLNKGSSYSWYKNGVLIPGANAEKYVVDSTSGPGKYLGVATIGACSITDSIQVIFVKSAKVNLGPDQIICPGASAVLNAGYPDATHAWYKVSSPFLKLDSNMKFVIKSTVNAGYFAVVSYTNHKTTCSYSDTANISFNHVSANLGPDTVLCSGQTYVLNAQNPGGQYSWYKDGVKQVDTLGTDTVSVSGKYYVTVLSGNCAGSDTVNITFLSVPLVSLAPNYDTMCLGGIRVLNSGNTAYKHLWFKNGAAITVSDTTSQYTVSSDGDYTALVENRTNNKCSSSDVAHIKYNLISVTFNLAPTVSVCQGQTLPITASVGSTVGNQRYYQWYKNGIPVSNDSTYTVDTPGKYKVIVNIGNCSASDSITVTYIPISKPDFGTNDTLICPGTTISLDAGNPGASYIWTTPKGFLTTEKITADTAFTYKVQVQKGKCIVDTSIKVRLTHMIVQLGKDTSLCTGGTLTLDAGNNINNATYQWYLNNNAIQGATLERFNPQETGTYKAIVYQSTCSDSGKIKVTFLPAPTATFFDTTVCYNDTITLDAGNPGYKIQWNKPPYQTTQKISVYRVTSPTPYREYDAYISNGFCSATSVFRVYYYNPVTITTLPASVYLCDTLSKGATLIADPGYAKYNWEPTGEITNSIFVTGPGEYTVKVTNSGGCSNTDSVHVYDCTPNDIYIPNAFTPNGDDINDTFRVYNLNTVLYQLTIYNRWGEAVFYSDDPNKGWGGTDEFGGNTIFKGRTCPEGIYKWTLIYRLNTPTGTPPQQIISGNVLLMRP